MAAIVSLRDVVDEMAMGNDDAHAYINRKTGELFTVIKDATPDMDAVEDDDDFADYPEWQRESLVKAREIHRSDDWLRLPHGFDLDEYGIMKRFAETVANPTLRGDLLDTIGGRGTFGRFKNMAARHGLLDKYHRFRETEHADFVAEWLEAHQIEYRR